ncbi:hypothetical protein DMENIID0001_008990 [Sergentomyia squamirostris]
MRNLGLPLQALSGSVGKIKLQVPARQFWTALWCIHIEKVNVVVGPVNLEEWDAEAEEQADFDFKVARLDRFEAKWRAAREACIKGGYYASSYSGWMNFGTSLVTNIMENLQLKISDVHIRKYAARCHGFFRGENCFSSPNYIRNNVRYIEIYSKLIRNPNEVLSAEEKEHKDHLERVREYEELKNLREICMNRIPCPEVKPPAKEESQGRTETSSSTPSAKDLLEDDILNALSTGVDTNSVLKRDAVFGKFDVTLKEGTLDICSGSPDGSKPMIQFFFENLILSLESRPR